MAVLGYLHWDCYLSRPACAAKVRFGLIHPDFRINEVIERRSPAPSPPPSRWFERKSSSWDDRGIWGEENI